MRENRCRDSGSKRKGTAISEAETFPSKSPKDTIRIAKAFAGKLKAGDVVRLEGDLGAGKTTFVKGLASGLGLADQDDVKSPTFVIMHIYPCRIPLYHFDLYRLEGAGEIAAIGFEDFMNDPGAISCVEWAERAEDFFPKASYRVQILFSGDTARKITITQGSSEPSQKGARSKA
ncbi:MAG TPA: tRNA (adenosine(37)-N6)-threonylcarbamoyltransferase complex ATPase subunit type 1 TsaE [Verrucomicrobiae bacterium]|nr:tRNA (adenosine(37)-N6)-threonylcarbamoyltransferase complex ATPase subunit type 1 TsaE [Verrucomicrobiae bacterium]